MVDKYGVGNDSYCYPETTTLKNKLGIRDAKLLEEAERDFSQYNANHIEFSLPPYDLDYLRHIHRLLFEDLYSWAGELRTVDISKGNTRFCNVRRLEPEAAKLFRKLADDEFLVTFDRDLLVTKAAEYYGDINILHPFREGNGRAQRIFFEHMIINAGYEISWEGVDQEEWIPANEAAVWCDYTPLTKILNQCIGDKLTK